MIETDGQWVYLEDNSSIGEMAEWLGITSQGLRWYEEQGLISPERDGAYRTYTREDRLALSTIRDYLKMGFSLDEIGAMHHAEELATLLDCFAERSAALQKELRLKGRLLEILHERAGALRLLRDKQNVFLEHTLEPSFFIINKTIALRSGKATKGAPIKHWAEETPFVRYFIVSDFTHNEEKERVIGAWLLEKDLACVSDAVRGDIAEGRAFRVAATKALRGMFGMAKTNERRLPEKWASGVVLRSPLACKKTGAELTPFWEVLVLPQALKPLFGLR